MTTQDILVTGISAFAVYVVVFLVIKLVARVLREICTFLAWRREEPVTLRGKLSSWRYVASLFKSLGDNADTASQALTLVALISFIMHATLNN